MTTSYFWFVVLTILLLGGHSLFFNTFGISTDKYETKNFGGPVNTSLENQSASVLSSFSPAPKPITEEDPPTNNSIFGEGALAVGLSSPFSNVIPTRDGLIKYKVQKGDNVSTIASHFDISINTILWTNPTARATISPGQELTILPVSGILYEIKEGDDLRGVASLYKIDPNLIKQYNPEYQKLLESPKATLILPYAKPLNKWAYMRKFSKRLPDLGDYFQLPADGWNWGELHYKNAVDIADQCGETIYASAEGLVLEASANNYWNDGYGNFVLIEHPNSTKTKYAHTLKNFVSKGDYVLQGDKIALIGSTGNTHGPTGCHLHFEVDGAQNPFAQ